MSDTGQYHQKAPPDIQYLVSLYVLMQTITTVGYGDFPATTSSEMIYLIMVIILGASGFGVVVGSMSSLLGRLDLRAADFKNNMAEVEDFMHKEVRDAHSTRSTNHQEVSFVKSKSADSLAIARKSQPSLRREKSPTNPGFSSLNGGDYLRGFFRRFLSTCGSGCATTARMPSTTRMRYHRR